MYNELPYFSLKQECKKRGISAVGKRNELLGRLNGTKEIECELVEIKPSKAPSIVSASPEELERFSPGAVFTPKIDTSKYAPWLTNERLEALSNKLAPIAASKGSFKFDINHKAGAYQCEFFGGASGPESTTLIDTDNQIIARARIYFNARMAKGGNAQISGL